jgi:hypothetical protein
MHGNEKLLIPFAIYGFVAGVLWVIGSTLYEPNIGSLSIAMNFPTMLSMFWIVGEHFAIAVPIPIWNTLIILWSVALWTLLGFLAYRVYRLLLYIPPD